MSETTRRWVSPVLVPILIATIFGIVGWAYNDRVEMEKRVSTAEEVARQAEIRSAQVERRLERIESKLDTLDNKLDRMRERLK